MDKSEKAEWAVIFALAIALTICIAKMVSKPDVEIKPTDTSVFEKRFDSLRKEYKKLEYQNRVLWRTFDSLDKVKIKNHTKVAHEIKQINNFTSDSRQSWNDSVLRANGLR